MNYVRIFCVYLMYNNSFYRPVSRMLTTGSFSQNLDLFRVCKIEISAGQQRRNLELMINSRVF